MLTSLFFVFATIAEFSLVLLVNRISGDKVNTSTPFIKGFSGTKKHLNVINLKLDDAYENKSSGGNCTVADLWRLKNIDVRKPGPISNWATIQNLKTTTIIDIVAFTAFIIGFLIFNIIYYTKFRL